LKKPAQAWKLSKFSDPALSGILGGEARVILLRLFFRLQKGALSTRHLFHEMQLPEDFFGPALKELVKLGVIKQTPSVKGSFQINTTFPYISELEQMVMRVSKEQRDLLIDGLKKFGKMKLIIVAGLFSDRTEGVDLLLVGDHVKMKSVDEFVKRCDVLFGRPLNYTLLDTKEFQYRYSMFDRFLREIFEGPHQICLNAIKNFRDPQ